MDREEFDDIISRMFNTEELRYGQKVFTLAYEIDPQAAELKRHTDINPFYKDANVDAFLEYFLPLVKPLQHLGYANGWGSQTPEFVTKCREKDHLILPAKLNGRCHTAYRCDICRYSYSVDSSD